MRLDIDVVVQRMDACVQELKQRRKQRALLLGLLVAISLLVGFCAVLERATSISPPGS